MRIIYDIETYPNVFTLTGKLVSTELIWQFEISEFKNESRDLLAWLYWIKQNNGVMIGFNNLGFDYPVLHLFINNQSNITPLTLYNKAQAIISSFDDKNRFAHLVYPSDRFIPQVDLFKIHHFDNKARSTSLKVLEFNMRADNVSDLPFEVGTTLNQSQTEVLKEYNLHDVLMTERFYFESLPQIKFREELTSKYGKDFMNHSDVKIGKEIFQMELEKNGVQLYKYGTNGREPNQTKRESIVLSECIPDFIQFDNHEFVRVHGWLKQQVITETKGVFKDLIAHVGGLDFVFGTGGIHASVENKVFQGDDEWIIFDMDVTSLYPSIAIEQGHYPEHLGKQFVSVYRKLRTQRVGYKKGSAENAMLKLALNGVYGSSNEVFSVFYDPQFTMKITLSGQLMIAMLAEKLLTITDLSIVQANTDGITVYVSRREKQHVLDICSTWEKLTRLSLEYAEYRQMIIADVNNYIAVGIDGKTKRKGKYEYDMEWHQNHSALVVAKVAEKVLVEGLPVRKTIMEWPDRMDFMLRVKVPRTSHLLWGEEKVQNTCRYYVSKEGKPLTKVMPPLAKKPDHWRHVGVESGWKVCVCNDIKDATQPIDYEYYINEVEKLVMEMT